jgi:putative transposase
LRCATFSAWCCRRRRPNWIAAEKAVFTVSELCRTLDVTSSGFYAPVAANLLDRRFDADAPNRRWVGDTTEFVIGGSGKLYLAAVLDLFSRFVVGWAVSAVNDRHVMIKAFDMALKRRCPDGGLLHHSDQGCTYASEDFQAVLEAHGITCSMSRRGNCYDCEDDGSAVRSALTPLTNDFVSLR